jgi:hypothetical protein
MLRLQDCLQCADPPFRGAIQTQQQPQMQQHGEYLVCCLCRVAFAGML